MDNSRADRTSTYVLVCGWCCGGRHGVVIRRCVGVRAGRHAVLKVGRVRLRDDVERPRGVLALVFVCSSLGSAVGARGGLGEDGRILERSKGRVEGTAEGLREGASVFGDGNCANGGHGGINVGNSYDGEYGVYIADPRSHGSAGLRERLGVFGSQSPLTLEAVTSPSPIGLKCPLLGTPLDWIGSVISRAIF
jgi:hypothetical protein